MDHLQQCYLFVFKVHFVMLDTVQLNGKVAWITDCQLFLDSEVRHDSVELDYRLTEFKTRFNALTTTQQS